MTRERGKPILINWFAAQRRERASFFVKKKHQPLHFLLTFNKHKTRGETQKEALSVQNEKAKI
jgi:hypothetical protein